MCGQFSEVIFQLSIHVHGVNVVQYSGPPPIFVVYISLYFLYISETHIIVSWDRGWKYSRVFFFHFGHPSPLVTIFPIPISLGTNMCDILYGRPHIL